MKLQNAILSGAVKYCKKPVEKMEDRSTNIRTKTTPPGFTKSTLENCYLNNRQYQAVITKFNLTIIDSQGRFDTALDELSAGQFDFICKQYYFGAFLISWLGLTEEMGKVNRSSTTKNNLNSFTTEMNSKFNFPEYDGEDVTVFGDKFIAVLKKVPQNVIVNPYFPIYLHDKYDKGLFHVEKHSMMVRDSKGKIIYIEDPTPYSMEINGVDAYRSNLIYTHPQCYLASFYHLDGCLDNARATFKAIMQTLVDRFEETQPYILQMGYVFDAKIINKHKVRLEIKIATTPKNCCDPFWDNFGYSNADMFDVYQNRSPEKPLTEEIEDSDIDGKSDTETDKKDQTDQISVNN